MIESFLENLTDNIGWFDAVFLIIMIYATFQCVMKGFTLSFISFMKWIVALIVTIILVPKLQPWVSEYIDSPFINNIGLSVAIYVLCLFLTILVGKAFSSSMKWTGFGPMDKTFGLFFGVFKGYVVSVCLYSIVNWFYPFNNWNIEVEKSLTFNFVKKGSEILIDEFPKIEDFDNTKEKIEKI
jgi:membrane protein required for colicin V production|tara:strand:+ start:511 stop:1059 length:549 start_codon:yes stop_codon:yes gene_type:complete